MISVRPAGIRVGGRVRGCRVTSFVRGSRFRRRMARQRQAVVVIFNSFFPPCVFLLLIHFADGKLGAVLWRWMKNQPGLGYLSSVLWLKQMFTYASFFIIIIIPPVNLLSISISSLVYHFMFNKYRFSMFIYPADNISSGNQIPTQILTVAASCQPACNILSLPDVQIRLCLI